MWGGGQRRQRRQKHATPLEGAWRSECAWRSEDAWRAEDVWRAELAVRARAYRFVAGPRISIALLCAEPDRGDALCILPPRSKQKIYGLVMKPSTPLGAPGTPQK